MLEPQNLVAQGGAHTDCLLSEQRGPPRAVVYELDGAVQRLQLADCRRADLRGARHSLGDPCHTVGERRTETGLNVSRVDGGTVARQNNALRDPRSALRHGVERPFKRQKSPIERHVDDERPARPNVAYLPAQRRLPGKERRPP